VKLLLTSSGLTTDAIDGRVQVISDGHWHLFNATEDGR
jgi:hypothetical protein